MYEPHDLYSAIFHRFLVLAAETERRLPASLEDIFYSSSHKETLRTLWPAMAADKMVDYRPETTSFLLGRATHKQVDHYIKAIELVIDALGEPKERTLVWRIARASAFKDRGPPWKKIADRMGLHPVTIKRRYEKALLKIALGYENSELGKQLDTDRHQLSSPLVLNKSHQCSLNS